MNEPMRFGEPTEVADGVFCIPTDYPAVADAPLWTHLLRGETSTLIDCGVPSTYDAVFADAFPRIGVDPREITWLLLTHGHPDHMGGHPGLRPHASFSVAAPLEDVIWVESVERQWHDFWDASPARCRSTGIRDEIVAMCGGDLPVDRILRDGDVFEARWTQPPHVVQTRGHTRGHCAYFEEATGVLFSGDSVQGHGIPSSSGTSVFAPLYDDVDDCLRGLARLRERCPSRCSAARTSSRSTARRASRSSTTASRSSSRPTRSSATCWPTRGRALGERRGRRDRGDGAARRHRSRCRRSTRRWPICGMPRAPASPSRAGCRGAPSDDACRPARHHLGTRARDRSRRRHRRSGSRPSAVSRSPGTSRSLQGFADASIPDLAQRYDLLVYDHPHIGEIVPTGSILALDGLLDDAFIADQAANSVGPSHASYEWDGHLWALAIDAAGHVSAYRPDLLERLGVGVPETWDDIWELDRVARPQGMHVSLPMKAVDTLATWLTLAANAGVEPYADEERILPRDVGLEHLETLHRLAEMSHPDAFAWNPILLLERMATADDVVACPILFGYSNYSRPGLPRLARPVPAGPVRRAGAARRRDRRRGARHLGAHAAARGCDRVRDLRGLSRDPAHAVRRVGRPARPPLGVARPGRERAVHGLLPRHAPRARRRLPAAALRRRADRPERGRRHHLGAPADRWRPERPARPPRRPLPAITRRGVHA